MLAHRFSRIGDILMTLGSVPRALASIRIGAICGLASCGVLGIDNDISVRLSPRSLSLSVGDTAEVSSTIVGGGSGSVYSRLVSESPEVATIIASDLVVANGVGSTYAVISAWSDDYGSARDSILVEVH